MSAAYEFIELEYVDAQKLYLDKIVPNYWWVAIKTEGPDPHTMKLGGIYEKPTSESDKSVRLKAVAEEWQEQLRDIEERIRVRLASTRSFLRNRLLDDSRFWAGLTRKFRVFFRFAGASDHSRSEEIWARFALISATFRACKTQPTDHEYVTAFAAWQRYALIKHLWSREHTRIPGNTPLDKLLDKEFELAYRDLSSLLSDRRYAIAFRVLWKIAVAELSLPTCDKRTRAARVSPPAWMFGGENDLAQPGIVTDAQGDLDPLIREHLRLSMVLMPSSQAGSDLSRIETERPYPSPACFDKAGTPLTVYQIHRYFLGSERAKLDVQQLIRDELLPNYNLWRASSVAALIRQSPPLVRLIPYLVLVLGFVIPGLFLLVGSVCFFSTSIAPSHGLPPWYYGLVMIVGFSFVATLALFRSLGFRSLLALFLPRVMGGILVGYFWLFVSSEPWYLVRAAVTRARWWAPDHWPLFWVIEWSLALLFCWAYLYQEAFARVTHHRTARNRSVLVLLLAIVQSLAIGAILAYFARPIGWKVFNNDQDIIRTLGYLPHFDSYYPVAALITFAPLAILLGILFQVLWLDQPITASVWQPDAR
jgi:hypothetical protein